MILEGGSFWAEYGERGARVYNEGLGGFAPTGFMGRAESFILAFALPKEKQIGPIVADCWKMTNVGLGESGCGGHLNSTNLLLDS